MKKFLRKPGLFSIALIFVFSVASNTIDAATITSTAAGGNWATGSTWIGGVVPATGDAVIIATTGANSVQIAANLTQTAAGSVTVNSGATLNMTTTGVTIVLGALTINSGGTVTVQRDFTVLGATNISGTINFGSTSGTNRSMVFTGNVILNSGAVWNETTTGAVADFTFNANLTNNATTFTAQNNAAAVHTFTGAGAKTISGSTVTAIPYLTINGATTNSGTLTVATILAGTNALTNDATGVLNIGGTSTITTLTTTAAGNTVNYTGAAQTIKVTSYYNLGLSGSGNKTFATGIIMANSLSINTTAIALLGNNNFSVPTLNLNGVGQLAGTYGSTASAATNKIAASFGTTGTGILTVTVGSCVSPTAFNVTGGGGYCAGGTGAPVGLSNSETGVTYQLFIAVSTPVGSPISGTGSNISFGDQATAGSYTVVATRTAGGCTNNMTGSATVTINPLPTLSFEKTDIKCFDANDGTITITGHGGSGSFTNYSINNGTNYQPSPVFGSLSPGQYFPRVMDSNGCQSKSSQ